MKSAVTLVLVALFVVTSVAVLAPMTVYTAPTGGPRLDARFCKATLGGTWTIKTKTCTITTLHVTSSIGSFTIPSRTTLATSAPPPPLPLEWGLTIDSDVTITNYGTIGNYGKITNYGTIINYGTFWACGTFLGSPLLNYGSIITNCPIS